MSFAVATTKTAPEFSAIQVSNVPSTRCDVPLSISLPPTPFSISSTHSTQGAMASAALSDSRRLRSVSP
jgi:hypothetical protein